MSSPARDSLNLSLHLRLGLCACVAVLFHIRHLSYCLIRRTLYLGLPPGQNRHHLGGVSFLLLFFLDENLRVCEGGLFDGIQRETHALPHQQETSHRVVLVEAVGDDGHGQAGEEHTDERAKDGDDSTLRRLRGHVPVAHRRHRDDGPVRAVRHVRERLLVPDLAEVDAHAEHDGADHHEEQQEEHLRRARPQGHEQHLQADVVPAELQRPHHSERVGDRQVAVGPVEHRVAIVMRDEADRQHRPLRNDRQQLDDVGEALEELAPVRRDEYAQDELAREEDEDDDVDRQERRVRVGLLESLQLQVRRRVDDVARELGGHAGDVQVGEEDDEDGENEDGAEDPAVDL